MKEKRIRIAVDAMGGDRAPEDVVAGVRLYAGKYSDTELLLVGREDELRPLCTDLPATIIPALTVVGMHESPSTALKTRKDSSIAVAVKLVKDGKADALLSMGNSGATVAFALFMLGRIADISKPAIVAPMPRLDGYTLLLDVGATVDCRPAHLLHFALMGSVYCRQVFNVETPRVGLLSIGEESSKGNELTFGTTELLSQAPIHFIGNVEGVDIMRGGVDVVVCDGFVGNVILKFGEGLVDMFARALKHETDQVLGQEADTAQRTTILQDTMARVDYTAYGGALLLGVNGHCLIGHGRSGPRAIANGIRAAYQTAEKCSIDAIKTALESAGAAA